MLTLDPAASLNLFISSYSFFWWRLGFSIYKIISYADKDNFTFLSYLDDFYSLYWLIALARISSTILNKNGESGHPYLVTNLRGRAFNISPLSIMLAVGLSYWPFLCWDMFLRYPICSVFVSWKNVFCQILFLYLLRLSYF